MTEYAVMNDAQVQKITYVGIRVSRPVFLSLHSVPRGVQTIDFLNTLGLSGMETFVNLGLEVYGSLRAIRPYCLLRTFQSPELYTLLLTIFLGLTRCW
jgi:predicted lipase